MATGVTKKSIKEDSITMDATTDNIPLPSSRSKLSFQYSGKADESDVLASHPRSYIELDRLGKQTKPTKNLPVDCFVLADNFAGLSTLLQSGKKVNLFYLDPPYATGLDFISRNQEHAYCDTMNSVAYIEFMRRRLILMRECLSDDGSIYVHIGHQMVCQLKIVMDEIFGESNFRNLITRRKCSSKNFTSKQYSNLNDYILFYSKTSNYKWFQPGETPDENWISKEYTKTDELGRKYKLVPIHAPGTRNGETGSEWKGMLPPPGKHWQYKPSKLTQLDEQGDIIWSKNGNPRRKVYLTTDKQISLSDYWANYRDAHHQSIQITGYPTEKNYDMLKMIIGASSEAGDLVVDPFNGSGTTILAAKELNRHFIGFDLSITAAKATISRFRHGSSKMGDYVNSQKNILSLNFAEDNIRFFSESSLWDNFSNEIKAISRI